MVPVLALGALAFGGCTNSPEKKDEARQSVKEEKEAKVPDKITKEQRKKLRAIMFVCENASNYLFLQEKCVEDNSRSEGIPSQYPYYEISKGFVEVLDYNQTAQDAFLKNFKSGTKNCFDKDCKKDFLKSNLKQIEGMLNFPDDYSVEQMHFLVNGYVLYSRMFILQ